MKEYFVCPGKNGSGMGGIGYQLFSRSLPGRAFIFDTGIVRFRYKRTANGRCDTMERAWRCYFTFINWRLLVESHCSAYI